MPFARVNNIDIHYRMQGEGPAVVFCHGLGGNHLSWWNQVRPLVAEGYQVITCDLRGFCFSTDDGDEEAHLAADLGGLIDHLGIDDVAVVGQSMGGIAAGGRASPRPPKVRALVLTSSVGGFVPIRVPAPTPEQAAAGAHLLDDYEGLLKLTLRQDTFWQRDPSRYSLYEQLAGLNVRVKPRRAFALGAARNDLAPVAEHKVPLMIISGDEDSAPVKAAITELAAQMPNLEHHVVAPSGHLTFFEQPEQFNERLSAFLKTHAPA